VIATLVGGADVHAGAQILAAAGNQADHGPVSAIGLANGSGHEYVVVRVRVCGKEVAPLMVRVPEGQTPVCAALSLNGKGAEQTGVMTGGTVGGVTSGGAGGAVGTGG